MLIASGCVPAHLDPDDDLRKKKSFQILKAESMRKDLPMKTRRMSGSAASSATTCSTGIISYVSYTAWIITREVAGASAYLTSP